MSYYLDPIDKPGLLISLMRAFEGDTAHISLEGDLSSYHLAGLTQATCRETAVLKRQTTSPILDLIVAPLTKENSALIAKSICRKDGLSNDSGLIHVQIERDGELVFSGCDNFHRECVFVAGLPIETLETLQRRHVIRGFTVANEPQAPGRALPRPDQHGR